MSWFDTNCVANSLTPWSSRSNLSAVMKAAATNVGAQQWIWGCLPDSFRALSVSVDNPTTLDTFVFGNHKPTYGPLNPFEEMMVTDAAHLDKILKKIGLDNIKWEPSNDFLIILHLRSHNRVLVRKVPKDWRLMFGSRQARDRFLTTLSSLGQYPVELRNISGW